ncbi:MAG: phytanoyl-CoA dioxygenase family protein [bacterium]|nr:phytanoyl-CoA dioxygenase family protein [bacterium]
MFEITELQKYLYDLQGFLVVEDVLNADQIGELKALIDTHDLSNLPPNYRFGNAGGSADTGPGFLAWGPPFVDLMDHPLVINLMRHQLGDCFRLDRIFGMHMRQGMPKGRLHSDYGASEPFSRAEPGRYYPQPAHQALHGFAVAAWNLTDTGPEHGGLVVIPGSHNGHYKLPQEIRNGEFQDVMAIPAACRSRLFIPVEILDFSVS